MVEGVAVRDGRVGAVVVGAVMVSCLSMTARGCWAVVAGIVSGRRIGVDVVVDLDGVARRGVGLSVGTVT